MPPEQIQGAQYHAAERPVRPRLRTARTPRRRRRVFAGGSDYELRRQHVSEPPPPLRTLRPDVPGAIEELVLALLAKAPEDRPADDYDVYQRLLPFLPLPRVDTARLRAQTSTMPDPTLVYRRSNLPRRRPEPAPVVPAPRSETSAADPVAILRTGVRDAIKAAVSQSDELLEDGRFAQAAEVLEQVIGAASAALGAESARVLGLRSRRAAILVIGGDFRRALPEFDALTAASAHTAGPTSEDALECLREAAHCRAELGQATTALRQFRQVLTDVRAASGDASPTALDLRRNIGMLLLSEDKAAEAADALQPLHDDLCVVYGPQHEETREAADVLARLRLAAGEQFRPTPPPHRGRRTSPPWLLPASMISMLPGRHEWSASSLPAC